MICYHFLYFYNSGGGTRKKEKSSRVHVEFLLFHENFPFYPSKMIETNIYECHLSILPLYIPHEK